MCVVAWQAMRVAATVLLTALAVASLLPLQAEAGSLRIFPKSVWYDDSDKDLYLRFKVNGVTGFAETDIEWDSPTANYDDGDLINFNRNDIPHDVSAHAILCLCVRVKRVKE